MNRPRTLSAAARSGGSDTLTSQGDTLNHLSDSMSRNRAVENDYSEHPLHPEAPRRSASAPSGVTDTRSSNQSSRSHRRTTSDRSRRSHTNRRRAPGGATRVVNPSASLPPYLGTRSLPIAQETIVSNRSDLTHPVIPPRPHQHPATVGHLPPRRHVLDLDLTNRPPPPVPRQHVCVPVGAPTSVLTSSVAPPRPPPPSAEVAERLGVPSCVRPSDSVVRTTPPASVVRPPTNTTVISTQPTTEPEKRRLMTDTDDEKTSTTKSDEATKTTNNSSLKKGSDRGRMLGSGDEDHQLMPSDGRSAPKPGEHNYPCPRCGKCTCPRCQGDVPGTTEAARRAASRCWACNDRCSCDAETCVETVTCLCCVRGCFYHCSNYEEDDTCTDEPCSCQGAHCCLRWTALGALSLFLPCLLCYPLARGCMRACKSCAACVRPGCRCKESYR